MSMSSFSIVMELSYFKCYAGMKLLPVSSPDLVHVTEAACSVSASMQGDYRLEYSLIIQDACN